MYVASLFTISVLASFLLYPRVIRRLKREGITGKDMNKPDRPEVAEMGGLVIVGAFTLGVLVAIALKNFGATWDSIDTSMLLAALSSVLIIAFLGVFDDLIDMRKPVKMLSPVLAALPLVAVKAGVPHVQLPFLGTVDFGLA